MDDSACGLQDQCTVSGLVSNEGRTVKRNFCDRHLSTMISSQFKGRCLLGTAGHIHSLFSYFCYYRIFALSGGGMLYVDFLLCVVIDGQLVLCRLKVHGFCSMYVFMGQHLQLQKYWLHFMAQEENLYCSCAAKTCFWRYSGTILNPSLAAFCQCFVISYTSVASPVFSIAWIFYCNIPSKDHFSETVSGSTHFYFLNYQ